MDTVKLALKIGTGVACLWETFAISLSTAGGPDMTISHNVDLHWWLGVPILGGLGLHFYFPHVKNFVKRLFG